MIGGTINRQRIIDNWADILRLATSIKQGTATASLLVKKLGSYPRQNGLAQALREILIGLNACCLLLSGYKTLN